MDFNVLTRVESHANQLFKRGLPVIPEEEEKTYSADGREVPSEDSKGRKRVHKTVKQQTEKVVVAVHSDDDEAVEREKLRAEGREVLRRFHYEDLFSCVTRNIGKGYMLGYLGMCSVNSLYMLLNVLRRRKVVISFAAVQDQARDYGLFMGLLLATYNAIMYETRKRFAFMRKRKHYSVRYRGALAGFVAGAALLWVPIHKRKPIILFTFVRAFELLIRMAVARGVLPYVPNADVLLMSVASAFMSHSFLFSQHTLDPGYVKFLSHHSQLPRPIQESIGTMQMGKPLNLEAINQLRAKIRVRGLLDPNGYDTIAPGQVLHPGKSTFVFTAVFFLKGVMRAFSVYLPVFTIPVLLFYPAGLVKAPVQHIKRVLTGVLRSSVFLALYTTFGIASISTLRSLGFTYSNFGSRAHWLGALAGGLAGWSTLVEKKSRRIELALYVLTKAVEGRYNHLSQLGYLPKQSAGWDVLVFMLSMATVMHAYVRHPEMIRSSYYSMMIGFFDSDERHVGTYLGIIKK